VSEPDLFVVCKNCSSEVSPYVTECPYCGQRVRKRAPKIERGAPKEPKQPRRSRTSLPRLRRGEIPGIATESRPYGTFLLIGLSLLASIAYATNRLAYSDLGAVQGPIDGDYWRLVATPFFHGTHLGYAFIALVAVGVFGTLLERRFGTAFVIATFLLAGAGGAALAIALEYTPAIGANGAALGLLFAWFVDDRLAARRGDDRENDLIGVYVLAALLLLLPVAEPSASFYAGLGGAAAGAVIGAIISPFRP
jgi:membrane associated rhomboid family serine protease